MTFKQDSPVAFPNGRNTPHLEHTGHGYTGRNTPHLKHSGSPDSTTVILCRFGSGGASGSALHGGALNGFGGGGGALNGALSSVGIVGGGALNGGASRRRWR